MKVAYDIALESMRGNPDAMLPKQSGDGWIYHCPAHLNPDFSGYIEDHKKQDKPPILRCVNGCSPKQIQDALRKRGLWVWDQKQKEHMDLERRYFGSWLYTARDIERSPLLQVVYWDYYNEEGEKVSTEIVQRLMNDKGKWEAPPPNWDVPPLHFQQVQEKAFSNRVVFSVDSEFKCELLKEWELVGFTTPGGANNIWGFENSGIEKDCKDDSIKSCVNYVVIIPDANQLSMQFARRKARFLHKHNIPCKLLYLPGLPPISKTGTEGLDTWIAAGHTKDELLELAVDAPLWPAADEDIEDWIPERPPTKAEIVQARKANEPIDPENDPFNYAFTDTGNALWFKKMCESYVAYLPGVGKGGSGLWFVYKDGIWSFDKARRVRSLMVKAVELMKTEMLASGRFPAEKVMDWRNKSLMSRGINAALTVAEDKMAIDDTEFNLEKWKIACINGVVCLKTGALLDHDPKYKFTSRVEVRFDPDKDASWDDAPVFQKFMLDIFPAPTLAEQWKRVQAVVSCFSVSMTADPKFKKWFLLYGPGGNNGKSTIAEFMLFLLGEGFATTARKALICEVDHETKFSNPGVLRGKRFGIMDEIGKRDKIDTEKMKSVTGNDSLTGDKVYIDAFMFKPTHYLYVYGNERPRFDAGSDQAAQKRCIVIPFLRSFTDDEIDGELPEKLRKEAEAVFAIMVWSCVNTWVRKTLLVHPFMTDAKNEYLKEEDLFGQFLEQCVYHVENAEITAEELHDTLVWWCRAEQGMSKPYHKSTMGKELTRRGYTSKKSDGYMIYDHLQIKPSCIVRQKQMKHRQQVIEYS